MIAYGGCCCSRRFDIVYICKQVLEEVSLCVEHYQERVTVLLAVHNISFLNLEKSIRSKYIGLYHRQIADLNNNVSLQQYYHSAHDQYSFSKLGAACYCLIMTMIWW